MWLKAKLSALKVLMFDVACQRDEHTVLMLQQASRHMRKILLFSHFWVSGETESSKTQMTNANTNQATMRTLQEERPAVSEVIFLICCIVGGRCPKCPIVLRFASTPKLPIPARTSNVTHQWNRSSPREWSAISLPAPGNKPEGA